MSPIIDIAERLTSVCRKEVCPLYNPEGCPDNIQCTDEVVKWLDERLVERKAGE
jgi:hypothetical protein